MVILYTPQEEDFVLPESEFSLGLPTIQFLIVYSMRGKPGRLTVGERSSTNKKKTFHTCVLCSKKNLRR